MTRGRSRYRCSDCGAVTARWAGRCPNCAEWNTLAEEAAIPPEVRASVLRRADVPVELFGLESEQDQRISPPDSSPGISDVQPTGIVELDRALGGGIVASSVTLLAGEPGIGKSTLLVQMLRSLARAGWTSLLVSAEESPDQVRRRAVRIGAREPGMWVAGLTELSAIRAAISQTRPDIVVIDSIQTVSDPSIVSPPGSVTQVRACAQALTDDAKAGGPAVVLVGHVTKDGTIAGPRSLEHLVDTVLSFEGDRHDALRLLRAVKHRFGPTGELGMFEMTASGLEGVADPSSLLLGDRQPDLPGSVVFAAMDGRRALPVEIQALVVATSAAARRSCSGYEAGRLAQLLAVLDRRAGLSLAGHDVYVSAVGGVRLADPGADLAVALAIASAATNRLVHHDLVAIGEVGLGGEIRRTAHLPARLAEARRAGFGRALVPPGTEGPVDMTLFPVCSLGDALDRHLGRSAFSPRLRVVHAGDPE